MIDKKNRELFSSSQKVPLFKYDNVHIVVFGAISPKRGKAREEKADAFLHFQQKRSAGRGVDFGGRATWCVCKFFFWFGKWFLFARQLIKREKGKAEREFYMCIRRNATYLAVGGG